MELSLERSRRLLPIARSVRGQGLIEVLVGIGLMGIMMAAFAAMISFQLRSTNQLSQKLASLDLERSLTGILSDGGVCSYVLTHPALSFNPLTVGTASPPVFPPIPSIPTTPSANSKIAVVADGSTPVSPMSSSLAVSSISVTDLACAQPPCTATSNQFSANIALTFEKSRLVIPLMPLKFPVLLMTSGPAGNQTVTGCIGGAAGALGLEWRVNYCPGSFTCTVFCPAGKKTIGGACGIDGPAFVIVSNVSNPTWWQCNSSGAVNLVPQVFCVAATY